MLKRNGCNPKVRREGVKGKSGSARSIPCPPTADSSSRNGADEMERQVNAWMRWRFENWLEWRIDHNPINNWIRRKLDISPCCKTNELLWWGLTDWIKTLFSITRGDG
jgi:hypothetical protein